jgi:hypothetical protein
MPDMDGRGVACPKSVKRFSDEAMRLKPSHDGAL